MADLPQDSNAKTIPLTPARIALAVTVDSTISTSTEITLNAATTFLRVYAKTQDIYMKWGTADVTSSNFDEIIPAGQICDFVVPKVQAGEGLYTAVNFIEETSGAKLTCIEK